MEELQRQYVRNFVIIVFVFLTITAAFVAYYDWALSLTLFGLPLSIMAYLYYFLTRYAFNFELINQLGIYSFTLYIIVILFSGPNVPTSYLYLILPVLVNFIFNGLKVAVIWALLMGGVGLLAYNYSGNFGFANNNPIWENSTMLLFFKAINILNFTVYLFFYLYYLREFSAFNTINVIKKERELEIANAVGKNKPARTTESIVELFDKIEYYFATNNNYKEPSFSIDKLAADLKSNPTEITKTLKIRTSNNFRTYLNTHRIKEVKRRIDFGDHDKFTLKHIYTEVGFVNQGTFNKFFKEVEGLTPSEYIQGLSAK